MTYFIWNMGCQMNDADMRVLSEQLQARGSWPVSSPEEADLVVVNTCIIRQSAENRALGRIARLRHLKRQRPERLIAVSGCLIGHAGNPDLANQFPFVDIFLPPSEFEPLLRRLPPPIQTSTSCATPVSDRVATVLGCSQACTYCVVPSRRGPEHSRLPEVILDDVRTLVRRGVREVTLLGQIVDRYGHDLGPGINLAGLLRAVGRVPGLHRLRFLTSHPRWFDLSVIEAVAELKAACPLFEIPVQSGNDDILRRMRRGYTVDAFRRLIEAIRSRVPDAALHTDVIVGFPGESEAAFQDTYRLLQEIQFDKVHVARYSPRPGTTAAEEMEDDVPEEEKERRFWAVEYLQREILARTAQSWQGKTVSVLVETTDAAGRWRGRTHRDQLVFFDDPNERLGQIVDVRIEQTDPFWFVGRPAASTAGHFQPGAG